MEGQGRDFKKNINDYPIQFNCTEKLYPIFNTANSDFMLTMFNLNYASQEDRGNIIIKENRHIIQKDSLRLKHLRFNKYLFHSE